MFTVKLLAPAHLAAGEVPRSFWRAAEEADSGGAAQGLSKGRVIIAKATSGVRGHSSFGGDGWVSSKPNTGTSHSVRMRSGRGWFHLHWVRSGLKNCLAQLPNP